MIEKKTGLLTIGKNFSHIWEKKKKDNWEFIWNGIVLFKNLLIHGIL